MAWLGVCSQGIAPLVTLDEGTVDHACYIEKVLPVALEYGNKVFGNDWIFQQDGAKPHQHYLTQQWCRNNFPSFIDKDCWPPNSPDLNPLDYSIWDELANAIDWNKVKSKSTLIQQLNSLVKKIRESVAFESCASQHFPFSETIRICTPRQATTIGIQYGVQATINPGDVEFSIRVEPVP
ncbi:unnamed protein product [Rotaria magnacalcarata]|uniref:Tc1-like transposase DDE domain-containing protein n=2 Tax=Rotaria magnacalcarata TaxID=392030 RepID=A0A816YZG1_9BILA|nr:unnamed protein product [Rotaria magnacalcarata]CAF2199719.1 unnamed protein product [Rotaria magnacalcarata]